jgi:membrane-associated phospholipid phosphatase
MRWQFKNLLRVYAIFAILLFLFLVPFTRVWIYLIDVKGAYFFNAFLQGDLFWHRVWNFLRSSKMDWCYDVFILGFALYYIGTKEKAYLRKIAESIFLLLFTIICFLPIHRGPIQKMVRPLRVCPLGTLSDITPLSKKVTGESRKGYTDHSYPSDHGYTVFMFIFACFFLRGWKFGLSALFISLPVICARFVTGTHWISDVTMGSIPIALFNMSWFFYSPLRGLAYAVDRSRLKRIQ